MASLIVLFLLSALVAVGLRLVLRRVLPQVPPVVRLIGLGAVIAGVVLAYFAFGRVTDGLAQREWPTVPGVIVSSEVTGERSFVPRIEYTYQVGSETYTASSDRQVPLFGGKRKTREVAEKVAAEYLPGMEVSVYYDPLDPSRSTILAEPRWNDFAQTGLGLFLFGGGWFLILLSRRERTGGKATAQP